MIAMGMCSASKLFDPDKLILKKERVLLNPVMDIFSTKMSVRICFNNKIFLRIWAGIEDKANHLAQLFDALLQD